MAENESQEKSNQAREELVQQFLEKMFSMVKQIHREISHQDILLSPPQARLIFAIARNEEKVLSVKELAKLANMTPGAITQFVDGLIKKDLVSREEDPSDRRIVRLKLTPSAKNQMENFKKYFVTSAARRFKVLDNEELRQLNDLLAKVSTESFIIE